MTGNRSRSSRNVDIVTAAYEALASGRIQQVVAVMDPDIEWRPAEHHPYRPQGGVWTTPAAVVAGLFDRVASEWESFRCVPARVLDAGDHVVVEGRYTARYHATQRTEDAEFCHIWGLHADRVVTFQRYVDTAQLRAVMGVDTPLSDLGRATFDEPDGIAATWRHFDARDGFETAAIRAHGDGHRLIGHTTAIEDGNSWAVGYVIDVDAQWRTIAAELTELHAGRHSILTVETGRAGHWTINGSDAPDLDGCIDIDLESSALTNTIFLHRAQPSSTDVHDASAAFIRCGPLRTERIEQTYRYTSRNEHDVTFAYTSPAYDTDIELRFDLAGLVLDYPGLATRHS